MNISESESRVMAALWDRHPLSSGEIVQRIAPVEGWSPKTVRTLLDRLVNKGALERRKHDRIYEYRPLLSRKQWLHEQTGHLVDRHCDGRLAPLVAAFTAGEHLSESDRREILALLEKIR